MIFYTYWIKTHDNPLCNAFNASSKALQLFFNLKKTRNKLNRPNQQAAADGLAGAQCHFLFFFLRAPIKKQPNKGLGLV